MKVLLTSDLHPETVNGVITSILTLKKALEDRGHEVKLLTVNTSHKSDKKDNDIYALGSISVEKIYPSVRVTVRAMSHLVDELIDWCPDIVHTQCEFTTFPIALRIAKHCNSKVIHTYHTMYEDYTKYFSPSKTLGKKAVEEFTKLISDHVDAMIAPSDKVKDLLIRYGVEVPIYTIPTGVNLSKFKNKPDIEWIDKKKTEYGLVDKTTLLYLGRIANEKRVDELISMMKDIPENVKLLIVGGGPVLEELKDYTEKEGLSNKVVFTDMINHKDVQYYYRLGDIFVSASTSETQGLTYDEALASELPMLCKQDKCLAEVIEDGVNGYQWKGKEDFIDDLNKMMNTNNLKRMSEESLRISDKFSIETFGKSIEAAYLKTVRHERKEQLLDKLTDKLYKSIENIKEYFIG